MVNFKSKGEVFRIRNYPITMRKWVFERDNYTRIQKFTKSFCNRTYIFVAEVESLELTRGNNFQVNCVVRVILWKLQEILSIDFSNASSYECI